MNERRKLLKGLGALAILGPTLLKEHRPASAEKEVKRINCPILMFHEVNNSHTFASQIVQRLNAGYHPINLDQTIDILNDQLYPPAEKLFVITFDDGRLSPFINAFPFLREWQIPATFFVLPDWPGDGRTRYMNDEQLQELVSAGMRAESHGFQHQSLPLLRTRNSEQWRRDIVDSKTRLEEIIGNGYRGRIFSYPYGQSDQPTRELVSQVYDAAVASRPGTQGTTQRSDNLLIMPRLPMS